MRVHISFLYRICKTLDRSFNVSKCAQIYPNTLPTNYLHRTCRQQSHHATCSVLRSSSQPYNMIDSLASNHLPKMHLLCMYTSECKHLQQALHHAAVSGTALQHAGAAAHLLPQDPKLCQLGIQAGYPCCKCLSQSMLSFFRTLFIILQCHRNSIARKHW